MPDRALVLTAGLGDRLRPLSLTRAKASVPLAGIPLVCRILAWLREQGVAEVVLNLHHRPSTITGAVGNGAHLGLHVRYSWEPTLLGSAGGPRHALELLDADRFFIVNGDTLTDVDLRQLAARHEQAGAGVSLALVQNPAPERYGGVRVDDDGWVSGFTAPGADARALHFIGVQVVEASVFADLSDGRPADSIGGIYRTLLTRTPRCVAGVRCDARFLDVGTPGDYLRSVLDLAPDADAGMSIGARSRVDPRARLIRTVIWDDVHVGPDAMLTNCVVADGARIPAGARFVAQAIAPAAGDEPAAGESLVGELLVAPLDPGPGVSPVPAHGDRA